MTDSVAGRTVLTLRDMVSATLWSKNRVLLLIYLGVAVAAVGYSLLFDPPGAGLVTIMIVVAMTVGFVALMLAATSFLFWRLSERQREMHYVVDRTAVTLRDATGAAVVLPWRQVKVCREHGSGFALFARPWGARWLVKRAFAASDVQAFRELARSTLGGAVRLQDVK
ncbi:MAG: hypothetical protein J0J01_10740 [Reyranella sp.]|uniref:YcxB family protein n=1 Tax=Reyranella sp. TaxID=1929291 RepID=UPI001AC49772|nr:YcxB family protein [Reyranella sp.]MBN9087373.1 hypothetical protein [Reyranella sp.]